MKKTILFVVTSVLLIFPAIGLATEKPSLFPLTQKEVNAYNNVRIKTQTKLGGAYLKFQDIDKEAMDKYIVEKADIRPDKFAETQRRILKLKTLVRIVVFEKYINANTENKKLLGHYLNAQEKIVERHYGFNIFKSLSVLEQEKDTIFSQTSIGLGVIKKSSHVISLGSGVDRDAW